MNATKQALLDEAARKAPDTAVDAATRILSASSKSGVRAAFLARALDAVERLAEKLDESSLSNAAGAPCPYAVLLKVMEDPRASMVLQSDDPLAPARIRGLRRREELLEAGGGAISAEEVAKLLHITRQAVDKRRKAGKLIGLETGRRGYSYPLFQFDSQAGMLPGLELVLDDLHDHGSWMKLSFLLNPNIRLGGQNPLHEMRRGHLEEVRSAARAYGEQGAA